MSLCNAPYLSFPTKNSVFILDTDASDYAIGAVLSQKQNGTEYPVAFGSRKLSNAEQRYCVTRKELLSVYNFVNQYKHYLLGRRFIIRTDHKALQWMLNWDRPNTSQYCQWIAELESFDFEIQHRPGTQHINADFLSRPLSNCMQCQLAHQNPQPKRNVKIYQINESPSRRRHLATLRRAHNDLGHLGTTKLKSVFELAGIQWESISKDTDQIVADCLICQRRKSNAKNTEKVLLHTTSTFPFSQLMIDIAGPLPPTKSGNVYIFSIVDIFSRFIRLIPLKSIISKEIIKCIEEHWVPFFGYPTRMYSDCGTNFRSREIMEYCDKNKIEQVFSSPYHPQSNGLVERYFRSAKDMIHASAAERQVDWDKVIHSVELGLRCSKQATLKKSPFQIIYGFNPRVIGCQDEAKQHNIDKQRNETQKNILEANLVKEKENNKKINVFNIGNKVMVRMNGAKPNIYQTRFFGPCTIEAVLNPKSYLLSYNGMTFRRNEDNIKPFRGNISLKANSLSNATSILSAAENRELNHNVSNHGNISRYPTRTRQPVNRYGYRRTGGEGDVI